VRATYPPVFTVIYEAFRGAQGIEQPDGTVTTGIAFVSTPLAVLRGP
jgi:hypothetical protein